MIVVKNCRIKLAYIFNKNRTRPQTHLALISRSPTGSEYSTLDTARRQMIQHRVIRHNQHTSIVLVRRRPIQDALPQEHWQ